MGKEDFTATHFATLTCAFFPFLNFFTTCNFSAFDIRGMPLHHSVDDNLQRFF